MSTINDGINFGTDRLQFGLGSGVAASRLPLNKASRYGAIHPQIWSVRTRVPDLLCFLLAYLTCAVLGLIGAYTYEKKLSHAWLAYMMLTESDGQNWRQLSWAGILECEQSSHLWQEAFRQTRFAHVLSLW